MTSRDETFRNFTSEQAAQYASNRGQAYPKEIYQTIVDYHTGPRNLCLDVGTGPGKVIWDLLAHFPQCVGCDTSVQMIEQAKKDALKRGVSDRTNFVVCAGEECADAVGEAERGTVDVVTCAMAVHWMELPGFYASVAKALRPGGTLALWTCSSFFCHPSHPNYAAIQAVLDDAESKALDPFMSPGNRISSKAYETLPLPWAIDETKGLFDETAFKRRDWDRNGVPSSPSLPDGSPGPFLFGKEQTLDQAAAGLNSSSAVVRWREAHREKAHTDEDPVVRSVKRVREAMGESKTLIVAPSCSLLLLRKA